MTDAEKLKAWAMHLQQQADGGHISGQMTPAEAEEKATLLSRAARVLSLRATITDGEALGALRSATLEAYLVAHGWLRRPKHGRMSDLWDKDYFEVILPNDEHRDKVPRMSEALRVLRACEKRSELQVYAELLVLQEAPQTPHDAPEGPDAG